MNHDDYYPDLVKALVYHHCHSDAKECKKVVQKRLIDGLDFDQAEEVIDHAAEELEFVYTLGDRVWYEQKEPVLIYIRDKTPMCLEIIPEDKFDHLTPPSLREKYNIG